MKTPYLMVMAAAACTTATVHQATLSPAPQRGTEGGQPPYTDADVRFMAGMIGHHAQAVLMAGWAPSHGASVALRALCERIVAASAASARSRRAGRRRGASPSPASTPPTARSPG